MPIDILKIDRSFTSRISDSGEPVTTAVLQLAEAMNLVTVAEGIKTPEQAAWLAGQDCDCLQGFLISAPLTSSAFARYVPSRRVGRGLSQPGPLPRSTKSATIGPMTAS